MQQQPQTMRGFTLIEMVVVIMLIGILAVVALPRLYSFTTEASNANTSAAQSSLQSALHNLQARWIAQGQPNIMTVTTSHGPAYLVMNAQGYPIGVRADTTGTPYAGIADNTDDAFAYIANALTNSSAYISTTQAQQLTASKGAAYVAQNYQFAISVLPGATAPTPGP